MATLELLIDASGMQRGAQQAEAALKTVQTASDRTQASVQNAGRSLSNAFQATGGSIQIAQGVAQTAKAFGDLNTAAGLFSASRVLLEIGKTADDFRQLNGAVRTSGGLWSSLGAIMRAHPLLTIASVIGAAASVMSLFSSNTTKSAEAFTQLGQAMRSAQVDERTARFLGISASGALGRQAQGVQSAISALEGQQSISARQLGEAGGTGLVDVLRFLRQEGNQDALTYLRTGQLTRDEIVERGRGAYARRVDVDPGTLTLTGAQARDFLRRRFEQLSTDQTAYEQQIPSLYQFGAGRLGSEFRFDDASAGMPANYVEQSAADRARVQEEAAARVADNMARAADYAEQIGQSFGAAIADVVLGATSLRQALAGLVQSGARQGLSSAFGAIFSGISSAAGKTFAQGAGDTGQGFTQPGTIPRSS